MNVLDELAIKYGTDKSSRYHGFTAPYFQTFDAERDSVKKVLEVGVFFGSSINMWRDYFSNAVIYGLDRFDGKQGNGRSFPDADKFFVQHQLHPDPRVKLFKVDQADEKQLQNFVASMKPKEAFDIIIDDGSHLMRDQQLTIGWLFPLLKKGGYYVIEDLHSSNASDYDVLPDGSNSTLKLLQNFMVKGTVSSTYLSGELNEQLSKTIESIFLAYTNNNSSITGIIRKK